MLSLPLLLGSRRNSFLEKRFTAPDCYAQVMEQRLIAQFTSAEKASPVPAGDQSSLAKSAAIRDQCIALLTSIRNNASHTALVEQLERLGPQLERHHNLCTRLKKWHFVQEFDSLGRQLELRKWTH